jgi:hypothetical protein
MPIQFVGPALTAAQSLSHTAGIGGAALTGQFGGSLLSPLAVGVGNYLRSDSGTLLKDRLRQGDIPGAFTAVTGFGRSAAPRLEQYNPPGFDPNQPVTLADLRKTVQETGPVGSAPAAPIAPPVLQLSPQDRAYQQERARVEAMVKSNPDMQKQEIAEARAKVRDKGMEEWAKANPDLAAKVMPGQSGFSAIQGFVGGVGAPTTGPSSAALQASPELNPASPTFVGGEGAPILRELSPELIKQYQEQLLKQAK